MASETTYIDKKLLILILSYSTPDIIIMHGNFQGEYQWGKPRVPPSDILIPACYWLSLRCMTDMQSSSKLDLP